MEELEETKTLTEVAQDKMRHDDAFLVFPAAMMDVALELPDMADGLGGYLTPNELSRLSSHNWKPIPLTDGLMLAHYSFDEDDEKTDVRNAMTAKGLVDIRAGRKVDAIGYEELVPNGFMICTKREMGKIQTLVAKNTVELLGEENA